jgi:hypothetical protein
MAETRYLSVETVDTNRLMQDIRSLNYHISDSGTYVINNQTYGNITVNVPKDEQAMEAVTHVITNNGRITNAHESAYSLALEIADTQSRLNARRIEHERLTGYTHVTTDIKSLITLQDRVESLINEVDYQERYLRQLLNSSEATSLYLSISEITADTPAESLRERISGGFTGSLENIGYAAENILLFATAMLLPAVLIAIVCAVVWICYSLIKRNRRRKI